MEAEFLAEDTIAGETITMQDIATFQTKYKEKNQHLEMVDAGQAYLQEEREVEEWDCETILTTYSTLDNHPALLKEKNSKYKAHRSGFSIRKEREDNRSESLSAVPGGREALTRAAYVGAIGREEDTSGIGVMAPRRIVLGGKLGLPEGYGTLQGKKGRGGEGDDSDSISVMSGTSKFSVSTRGSRARSAGTGSDGQQMIDLRLPYQHVSDSGSVSSGRSGQGKNAQNANTGAHTNHRRATSRQQMRIDNMRSDLYTLDETGISLVPGQGYGGRIEEEGDEDEDGDDDSKSAASELASAYSAWTLQSRKDETKEEKKARKLAAKETQKAKRVNKKAMRGVYKEESANVVSRLSKQTHDNVSVFKY